jgi:hypothetical protein
VVAPKPVRGPDAGPTLGLESDAFPATIMIMIATRDYNIELRALTLTLAYSRRTATADSQQLTPMPKPSPSGAHVLYISSRVRITSDLRHYRSKDTASRLPLGKRVSRRPTARSLQKRRMTAATAVASPTASRRLQPFTTSPWARKNIWSSLSCSWCRWHPCTYFPFGGRQRGRFTRRGQD